MAFGKKKNVQSSSDDDLLDFGYDSDSFGGQDDFGGGDSFGGGDQFGYNGGQDDFGGGGKRSGGKKNSGGIGKILIPIAVVLVIVIVAGSIISSMIGPTRGDCKEVLETFEDGCNELDFLKLADVVDPTYRNAIKAILITVSGVLPDDVVEKVAEIIDNATGGFLGQAANGSGLANVMRSVKIEPMRFGMPGKSRVVKCKVTAGVFDAYINVTIKKKNKECYIAKVEIAKD